MTIHAFRWIAVLLLLRGGAQAFQIGDHATATGTRISSAGYTYRSLLPSISSGKEEKQAVVQEWIRARSDGDISSMLELMTNDCCYDDYDFGGFCIGKAALERQLRLVVDQQQLEIANVAIQQVKGGDEVNVGVRFLLDAERQGAALFVVLNDLIRQIDWVLEPPLASDKKGESKLQLLSTVSKVLELIPSSKQQSPIDATATSTPAERYFEAWNRRDMDAAAAQFTPNVCYDDTAFPNHPLTNRDDLDAHLRLCSSVFPATFRFEVDRQVLDGDNLFVQWHVENNGAPLPFSRGCSFYQLQKDLIAVGVDIVEPTGPIKPNGWLALTVKSVTRNLSQEDLLPKYF